MWEELEFYPIRWAVRYEINFFRCCQAKIIRKVCKMFCWISPKKQMMHIKKKILPKFRSKIKFCETQHFVPSKSDFCKKWNIILRHWFFVKVHGLTVLGSTRFPPPLFSCQILRPSSSHLQPHSFPLQISPFPVILYSCSSGLFVKRHAFDSTAECWPPGYTNNLQYCKLEWFDLWLLHGFSTSVALNSKRWCPTSFHFGQQSSAW